MKTKLIFLVFSFILVLTSCQKEEVTDMVDAVGTTNTATTSTTQLLQANTNTHTIGSTGLTNIGGSGSTSGGGLNNTSGPDIPVIPDPNDCASTCNYAYYFEVEGGVELGTCDAYTGPLNPIGYDWQATKIHYDIAYDPNNPPTIHSSNTNRIDLEQCNTNQYLSAYSVTVTITFDNNTTDTHNFCYNDYDGIVSVCSGNQMGMMATDGDCTGSATASLILP